MQVAVTNPDATFSIAIPNNVALMGLSFYSQGAVFEPAANPFGMMTSNQVILTIGNS